MFERDRYQGQNSSSSHRLIVINIDEVETGIRQPVIKNLQTFELDHVVKEQQNVEQSIKHLVEQQVPHEETTLRRSTRGHKIKDS